MTVRTRSVLVALVAVLSVTGSASAQRRGVYVSRPGAVSRPFVNPTPQQAYRPGAPMGAPTFRPMVQQPMGAPMYRPVAGVPVVSPMQRPYANPGMVRPGGVYAPGVIAPRSIVGVPAAGRFRPVAVSPVYPGAPPMVTVYGRPPMGGYPGGVMVSPDRYPVYGGYAPLVTRYEYHPEYFSYVPGGIWFTQPDYLADDSNVYIGQYRAFLDQAQQSLAQRVQNGELPADVLQDAQGERNYIEQVINSDVASTGTITPDERVQLRELADGMIALNNYQPQAMQVDQGAYMQQPDPSAMPAQQFQAPPSVDPSAYPQPVYPQQPYPQPMYPQQ